MRISTIIRHFREGFRSIWRNGWMAFATISSIAICLLVLGVFVLIAVNVNHVTNNIEQNIEIRVFLDVGFPQAKVPAVQDQIGSIPGVKHIEFIPKAIGLQRLREQLGEDGKKLLETQKNIPNPIPDAFLVKVYEPRQVEDVANRILLLNEGAEPAPIMKVNYGAKTVRMLFNVIDMIRYIGVVLIVALTVMTMFLIANTIKITIIARRSEISIMKLVGATHNFIRWPFFVEGVLLGALGALIPIVLIVVFYGQLLTYAQNAQDEGKFLYILLSPGYAFMPWVAFSLVALGQVMGIWGSTLSIRRYLKV